MSDASPSSLAHPSPTVEVRWFLPGGLPTGAVAWIEAIAGRRPERHARTDRYLVPPTPESPNVKLRGVAGPEALGTGRLEIKRWHGAVGAVRFGCALGLAERWVKWRFPLADQPPTDGAPGWVLVEKERYSCTLDAAGRATPVEQRPESGCDLEVSTVRVGRAVYGSVCFEAFGSGFDASYEALRRAGRRAFASGSPPTLTPERSMGYPALLARTSEGP